MKLVDKVVDTLSTALKNQGMSAKAIERWYSEMPREEEMLPKDKYTIFDRKEKKYRKGIHSKCPSWGLSKVIFEGRNGELTYVCLQNCPSGRG